jgi:HEAT repeat protein
MAMGSTMNDEEWAVQMIQEWKTCDDIAGTFSRTGKVQKLEAMAKKDPRIMRLVLKELDTRNAADQYYPFMVAQMLARIEARDVLPVMFRILQDKGRSDLDRFRAASVLGLIGKPALPILAEALKSSDVFGRKQAASALTAMGDLGGKEHETGAIFLIFQAMQDENMDVRTTAIECFAGAFSAKCAGPYLRKALQHENPLVRAGAADALIEYKVDVPEAEKTLLALLGHANAEVRFQALRGFRHEGRSYGIAALMPLRKSLTDKDARVRAGAARALGNLGPASETAVGDLLDVLKKDLKGEYELIARGEAATALGRIGPAAKEAVPALIAALKENNYLLPFVAVNALGDIGPDAQAAIPILERFLQEDGDNYEVALALRRIQGRKTPDR